MIYQPRFEDLIYESESVEAVASRIIPVDRPDFAIYRTRKRKAFKKVFAD